MKNKRLSAEPLSIERRRVVQALVALPVTLAGCGAADVITAQSPMSPASVTLNPTPACADDDDDDPALLMSIENGASGQNATFTFVLMR